MSFGKNLQYLRRLYRNLTQEGKVNGWEHEEKDVIPCFETYGDTMDVYIACK